MTELLSLKQSRKALKGVLTKRVNELRYVIDASDDKEAVILKLQELESAFLNFGKCHSECHSLFRNEVDIEESHEYFQDVEASYVRAKDYADDYISRVDDRVDALSCGATTHRTTSSAKTRAAAKRAALMAQQTSLRRKQELEREKLQLEQKQDELDIETRIAVAEAQERVYSEYEEGENTQPKIPLPNLSLRAMAPQYTAPRFKREPPDMEERRPPSQTPHHSYSDQDITRDLLISINLPKLEIASFDGNPLRFWVFTRSFDNAIGSTPTSCSSKLTRLLQYCTGKALKLIQCCAVMDPTEGYHKARALLRERFGDNFVISEAWIKTVTERPVIKANDKSALQEFADDLHNCKETLEAMGKLREIDTQRSLSKLVDKLPAYLQNRWRKIATTARKRHGEYPNFSALTEFIESAADEANDPVFGFSNYTPASTENKNRSQQTFTRRSGSSFNASVEPVEQTRTPSKQPKDATSEYKSQGHGHSCVKCGGPHALFACDEFKQMSPEERFKLTREARLCDNCLNPYHIAAKCYRQTVCSVPGCGKKHSKFLHMKRRSTEDGETQPKSVAANNCVSAINDTCYVTGAGSNGKTALPILPISVKDRAGHIVNTYALLDSGSTNTFCSERLIDLLGLSGRDTTLSLTTLEQTNKQSRAKVVELEVSDIENKSQIKLPHVFSRAKLPISSECIPIQTEISKWPHLKDLNLPEINNCEIMLLIGQDVPEALVPIEVRRGKAGDPYAVRTVLGWTLNGPIRYGDHRKAMANFVQTDVELTHQVKRFCDLESLISETTDNHVLPMSVDDMKVLETWEKSATKVNQHYQMDIPFKTRPPILPNNRSLAEQRLNSLHSRLRRDSWLSDKYTEGIGDLLKKGYAECVPEETAERGDYQPWYIPHHPVQNPNKRGKIRIVFDCAAQCQGISLNQIVHQGPNLTNSLIGALHRFRQGQVAIMADVEAMYHQVFVSPGDRDALRFLWREDDAQTQEYRMTVHLFGGIWSASCANYALKRTADDNSKSFDKEIVDAVHKNFYVDDFLKSVETQEEATKLVDQIPKLLARGGFHLKKWTTNHPQVLSGLPPEDRHDNMLDLDFDGRERSLERVLGVQWNVQNDELMYKVTLGQRPCTRRGVISTVSSIYDPLGILGPCIIRGKMIFQALCRLKLSWDEEIPEPYLSDWRRWLSEIPQLEAFTIPRCVKSVNGARIQSYQLHHFSDASSSGYGAVSYLRIKDVNGNVHCSLLMSKSRLAPLKTLTIPRLELSAAVLSVQLDKILRSSLEFQFEQSVFWTDSTLVLQYVQNETRRFQTFVANRVSAIHDQSACDQWHHIRSEDNPADAVSRGLLPSQFLPHKLWATGPHLLYGPDSSWTASSPVDRLPETDPEIKPSTHLYATAMSLNPCKELLEYHSSWDKLKTSIAWLLRLKQCLQIKVNGSKCILKPHLSADELSNAEREIIKLVQRESYSGELASLKSGHGVKRSSPIYRLDPQLNSDNVICVKGRLHNAPIDPQARHPYIIPGKHHIAILIIRNTHEAIGHSGREHVLAITRSRFWITGGRAAVNRVLSKCFDCKRRMAAPKNQRMGDLPEDRVTPFQPAFSYVGTDCFGPFMVKRGRARVKMYGCIFTCLTTRAVHIEMLHGLDTDSFINGLQRFIARRGHPIRVRSDNGTNFTGAERELKSAIAEWNVKQIHDHMKAKNIDWVFNPPGASHMGGSWERQIRTIRKVFTALTQQQTLDMDGLQTLMCITESIINSRPITKVSDDPKDLHPLTPNHMLLLRAGSELPPGVFVPEDTYRRRWRQIQYLANIFWKRWVAEYLPNLQRRQKWLKEKINIKPGDVVLVVAENCPRSVWPLACVLQVYHGQDGLVRTVKIRTKSSELLRPVHKLCLLESIDDNIDE